MRSTSYTVIVSISAIAHFCSALALVIIMKLASSGPAPLRRQLLRVMVLRLFNNVRKLCALVLSPNFLSRTFSSALADSIFSLAISLLRSITFLRETTRRIDQSWKNENGRLSCGRS